MLRKRKKIGKTSFYDIFSKNDGSIAPQLGWRETNKRFDKGKKTPAENHKSSKDNSYRIGCVHMQGFGGGALSDAGSSLSPLCYRLITKLLRCSTQGLINPSNFSNYSAGSKFNKKLFLTRKHYGLLIEHFSYPFSLLSFSLKKA